MTLKVYDFPKIIDADGHTTNILRVA